MVKLILWENGLVIGLLLMIIVGGAFDMMEDVRENGFEYEETVIIHGKAEVRQVTHKATLLSMGLMTGMLCVLLVNTSTIWKNPRLKTSFMKEGNEDEMFPKGSPEYWRYDVTLEDLEVQINDLVIRIPLEDIIPTQSEDVT